MNSFKDPYLRVHVREYDERPRPPLAPFYVSGLGVRNSPYIGGLETLEQLIDRVNLDKEWWALTMSIASDDYIVDTPDMSLDVLLQAAAMLGPAFNHITAQSVYVPPQVSFSLSKLIVRSMLIM